MMKEPIVAHADDEAWHVLEGAFLFRLIDREVDVGPGETAFVPAGVLHTYAAADARYLIIPTPRLDALIAELQSDRNKDAQRQIPVDAVGMRCVMTPQP